MTKNSSSILAFKEDQVSKEPVTPCINCGRCAEACPTNLMPVMMMKAVLQKDIERFQTLYGTECIECGCCSYVCPAKRPLTQGFKEMKRRIKAEMARKAAAEKKAAEEKKVAEEKKAAEEKKGEA